MKQFQEISGKQFSSKLSTLVSRSNAFKASFNELTIQACFTALAHNDIRRCEQLHAKLSASQQRQLVRLLRAYGNVRGLTKADHEQAAKNGTVISEERKLTLIESRKTKTPGSDEAIDYATRQAELLLGLGDLLTHKPESTESNASAPKPVDLNKTFNDLLTRVSERGVNENSETLYKALESFKAIILSGLTLDDLKAELLAEAAKAKPKASTKTETQAEIKAA